MARGILHTQLLSVPTGLPSQFRENVHMNLAKFCAFAVNSVVTLNGVRRGRVRSSFVSIGKVFPILVLACLAFTASPLHAQDNVRTAVHKVPPIYPELAKQMHLSGTVSVSVTVDPSGKVIKAESDSTKKIFIPAALMAVKQWKFAPADTTDTFPIMVNFERAD